MLRFYTVWAGSSPSLPDGSNPSAAIVQSASDVQCSRLLKTTHSRITDLHQKYCLLDYVSNS
ncbi:hypothetical protein CAZ14_35865 [Pseudomonas aeruginosa]|nr:hypothetical protein CAZ14_35865 [Pseudomonas aeruginosa]